MKYTSASVMHSRVRAQSHPSWEKIFVIALFVAVVLLPGVSPPPCRAAVVDRVVAAVDDTAITLSEFQEHYAAVAATVRNAERIDVLNSMINSLLLLQEARKMRLEAPTKDELVREYIDIRIKASIIIREEEIEAFYREHKAEFAGKDYIAVRDEIERYLFEAATNRQLKKHLEELRRNAEIAIQLTGR